MKKLIQIITIKRLNDNKIFSIGDIVTSDNFYRGNINGFQQFEDDFRVHLDIDDHADREYFSITELD